MLRSSLFLSSLSTPRVSSSSPFSPLLEFQTNQLTPPPPQETADLLSIIARNFPTLRPNLPAPAPAASDKILIDASKTTRDLGFAWMGLERTVVDTIAALLVLEAKFNLAAEKGKGEAGGAGDEVGPVVKF